MPPAGEPSAPRASRTDGLLLVGCALAATLALIWVAGPLFDGDVWWHVRLGAEIVDRASVSDLGRAWTAVGPDGGSWVTTQWAAELLMHTVQDRAGWSGLGWLRLLGEVALLASLWWSTTRDAGLRAATGPFVIAALGSAVFVQDRPQQITYVLCPVVGLAAYRFANGRALPHPAVVVGVVLVWAQFHPGWVLVPALLAVLILGRLADGGRPALSTPQVRRALWLIPATVLAGSLTPAGPNALLAGPRISRAARDTINEWQPPGFDNIAPVLVVVLVAVLVASWSRHDPRPSRAELVLVAAVCAFAAMAFRNVVPALLLLAPVVAGRLEQVRTADTSAAAASRPGRLARAAAVAVLVVGFAVAGSVQATADPFAGSKAPTRILAEVNARAPARVLTTYNLGGFFAGLGAPGVVVSIDGRTDYYGADYIRRHADLVAARPGWQDTFDALGADVVVLESRDALVAALEAEGWTRVITDKGFVLLEKGEAA